MSETEEVKPEEIKKNTPAPIPVNESGLVTPSNNIELVRTITEIAAGGGFPECFKTPAQRFAAYTMARALAGDSFQLALNNLAIIKGKMSMYGELPKALAQRTGEVEAFKVYAVDEHMKPISLENNNLNAIPYAGVCDVKRKGQPANQFTYTIAEARTAGQYPPMKAVWENNKKVGEEINNDSPWIKFTRIMLMRKAQAMAVKFEFPDAIIGTPVAEDYDEAPDLVPIRDVKPSMDKADLLNNSFRSAGGTEAETQAQ